MEEGWNIKLVTQPAQSPDPSINDLDFFASLKSRRYGTVDELVERVSSVFHMCDTDRLERLWQSLFKRCNKVLRALGGNDFEVEHIGTIKRQREGRL
ncbi:unnamed protein product, partial [Choristocarpus tenellus]